MFKWSSELVSLSLSSEMGERSYESIVIYRDFLRLLGASICLETVFFLTSAHSVIDVKWNAKGSVGTVGLINKVLELHCEFSAVNIFNLF